MGGTMLGGYSIGIQIWRPWVRSPGGAGWRSVVLSLRVNSSADLFVPDPPSCVRARTQTCTHVKDPISVCSKRVGLTVGSMETRNTAHMDKKRQKKKEAGWWVLNYYGCLMLAFPQSEKNVTWQGWIWREKKLLREKGMLRDIPLTLVISKLDLCKGGTFQLQSSTVTFN